MIKVLFLIPDLSVGGAEKVLVNLVNNMDSSQFDITVMTLFGGGVNERFLKPHIKLINCFRKLIPGNSKLMKLFSPEFLHSYFIKEQYDIEISYLEGPCARIISGCKNKATKLISWIHIEQHTREIAAKSFRSYSESFDCYNRFHLHAFVAQSVQEDFCNLYNLSTPCKVLYNTNESDEIRRLAQEEVSEFTDSSPEFRMIGVGKIIAKKDFMRLARIHSVLRDEGFSVHTYVLGKGPQQQDIELFLKKSGHLNTFTFLGYKTNPYKYVSKCDLFVCCSHAEGFSTATTEALIVGTPVCTTNVSGMKEMLGANGEYGIVTENNELHLLAAIRRLFLNKQLLQYYKQKASERGAGFSTKNCVTAVETTIKNLLKEDCDV